MTNHIVEPFTIKIFFNLRIRYLFFKNKIFTQTFICVKRLYDKIKENIN